MIMIIIKKQKAKYKRERNFLDFFLDLKDFFEKKKIVRCG